MKGCCKTVASVAVLIISVGILVLCISGAGYLDRASPPDTVELGTSVDTPDSSFKFTVRGTKNLDSKKDHLPAKVDGLSSY